MKKLAVAAGLALALSGAPVMAGGVAVTPVDIVIDDTASSSGGILVPILALVMFAAALSG